MSKNKLSSRRSLGVRHPRDRREHLLAEAATRLSPRLPYAEQLSAVARLAPPEIGDWCVLDVIEDQSDRDDTDETQDVQARIHRVTSSPTDTRLEGALWELEAHAPAWGAVDPIVDVLTSGSPLFISPVTNEWVAERFGDQASQTIMRSLNVQSLMIVPLLVDARPIGALTIGTTATRTATEEEFSLAQLLAERAAAAIEAARLYHRAQRSTAARDAVLGVVSHDLLGTLGTVTMNARRLLDRDGDWAARQQRLCENILNGAEVMHRLVLDLVDVSAIEMRRLSVTPVVQPMGPVLSSAAQLFAPRAEAMGIQLSVADAVEIPEIRFDGTRLLQVLSNLLDNALKFTPVGGSVTVAVTPAPREIVLSVADTGSGVAPDELAHVFERFWRAPAGRRTRGLGLGLAIVRGVAAAHGGRVWMQSMVGRGTTVFVALPR